ncbi:MAG: NADH-quinone oxidoreductase subunit L [Flavobacteriales bacterium]|nr:NADH-quinone oxidoreductase subunit L [Flavobacteriales bacterium]MBQ8649757.1 NADH-quinone oxidoreductase subunit L [Flavobacteriales bacterium]
MEYSIFVLLLPMIMFLFIGLLQGKLKGQSAGIIGTISMSLTTIIAYAVAFDYFFSPESKIDGIYQKIVEYNWVWLQLTENLHIDLGILLDPISCMMLVVITTVSLMVHIYSLGYMHGERGFARYYAFLSLFSFSMLGLVVATNIFQMYIFWELVGVSSYLLIGFYYTKPAAIAASKKAFIVTRFADLGFLIGILVLSFYAQSFSFTDLTAPGGVALSSAAGVSFLGASAAAWGLSLIFVGGAGKSAMFPLHIWLPDAMEGPTPVSALIHAATMVVAGVYLVARMFPLYIDAAPEVLPGIAYVGAFTSLFAAVIACFQSDIKRVLAFSTISQIGFMIVALGVSGMGGHDGLGYMAGMWHLFTHAMFKALLFLGAGAVIHAVHSNEMSAMGGLRKYMPVTHITFLIACLAIAGIPPFSGFFSKDEILSACLEFSPVMFALMAGIAGLTAFYMFRLYYRIFWSTPTDVSHHTPHEAPAVMYLPLIFLAAVTLVAGFIPFGDFVTSDGAVYHIHINWTVATISIVVAVVAIAIATVKYMKEKSKAPENPLNNVGAFYRAAYRRFYIDEVYMFVTHKIIFAYISRPIKWFDRHVVDGFMNFLAWGANALSGLIKGFQSGQVQQYAYVFVLGVIILIVIALAL